MCRHEREVMCIARKEASNNGIIFVGLNHGKKYLRLLFRFGKVERFVVCASTPSCCRALVNTRHEIKRAFAILKAA